MYFRCLWYRFALPADWDAAISPYSLYLTAFAASQELYGPRIWVYELKYISSAVRSVAPLASSACIVHQLSASAFCIGVQQYISLKKTPQKGPPHGSPQCCSYIQKYAACRFFYWRMCLMNAVTGSANFRHISAARWRRSGSSYARRSGVWIPR